MMGSEKAAAARIRVWSAKKMTPLPALCQAEVMFSRSSGSGRRVSGEPPGEAAELPELAVEAVVAVEEVVEPEPPVVAAAEEVVEPEPEPEPELPGVLTNFRLPAR